MIPLNHILYGAVLPGVACALLFAVAWRAWQRGDWGGRGHWAGPVAAAGAFAAAVWAVMGVKPWPPVAVQDRLVYLVAGIGAVGLVDALVRLPWHVRVALVAVTCAAASWVVLWPVAPHQYTEREAAILIAGAAVVLSVLVTTVDWAAARVGGVAVPVALVVWTASTAAVIALSGTQSLGQFVGGLSAAAGAAAVVAVIAPTLSLARGGVLVIVTAGLLTLATGFFYGYPVSPWFALPLVVAPLLIGVGALPLVRDMRPGRRAALVVVLVLVPCAVAAGVAGAEFARSQTSSSGDEMYGY